MPISSNPHKLIRKINRALAESKNPRLQIKYRGLTIPELFDLLPRRGNSPSPEAVFWLLLTGDVPTNEQAECLMADWTERRDKRKEWWWSESSGRSGGVVGNVLRALPRNVPPVSRLAIALTAIDADKHYKKAVKTGALSYTYWEVGPYILIITLPCE
jgi:citrate synthase